jgi:hypothetical protein
MDTLALARYFKSGVFPRFPIGYLYKKPLPVEIPTDLEVRPATSGLKTLNSFRTIDQVILGFGRDPDHEFLLGERQAYLYFREGRLVGYGYIGKDVVGPVALLEEGDFPAVLAQAEAEAAARHEEEFGLNLPLVNRAAVGYLLERGFQLDTFIMLFLSDEPFGRFENYIFSSPLFI